MPAEAPTVSATASEADSLVRLLREEADREDRYEIYEQLRRLGPVVRCRWGVVVTGYEQCAEVLKAHDLFGQFSGSYYDRIIPGWKNEHQSLQGMTRTMLLTDPPEHTRLRALVRPAFVAQRLRDLEPGIVRRVASLLDDLEDEIRRVGHADAMSLIARPLAVLAIGDLLGMPDSEALRLIPAIDDLTLGVTELLRSNEQIQRGDHAMVALGDYALELMDRRRQDPGDDLVSMLVRAHQANPEWSDYDLASSIVLILSAGDIPFAAVGNTVLALTQFPEVRARLSCDPSLVPDAVEEFVRYDSPAQVLFRTALVDTTLAGCEIKARDDIYVVLAAANRDPKHWKDPNILRLDRKHSTTGAFGHGIHYCIGAGLARLELKALLLQLCERFPTLSIAGTPVRSSSITVHSHDYLPVSVTS